MKKVIALLLTLIVGATWFAGCTPDPEAHAHEWSEWTVAAEASCEKDGKRVRECEGCGRKQYQVIEGGHQWGDWATVTPQTCPEPGLKQRTCTVCGEKEDQVLPALGTHQYEMTVSFAGDCISSAEYRYTCTKCGDSYTEKGNYNTANHFGDTYACGAHCVQCAKAGQDHTAVTCGVSNHFNCDGLNHTECAIPTAANMVLTEIDGGTAYRLDKFVSVSTDTDLFVPAFYNDKPVVEIADSVFNGSAISYGAEVREWLNKIKYIYVPDTVKVIGNFFAYKMDSLEEVRLPKAVESYGWNTFYDLPALTSFNIPEGVEKLDGFVGNPYVLTESKVASVTIPESFTDMDALKYVLNSAALETVNYQGTEDAWNKLTENFPVDLKADPTFGYDYQALYNQQFSDMQLKLVGFSFEPYGEGYAITGYPGIAKEELVIPETILEKPVLALATDALDIANTASNNVGALEMVKSIVFEANLEYVGDYNFFGLPNLEKVILPETVTYVGSQCFYNCAKLTEVYIPAGAEMDMTRAPFSNCPNLVKANIPGIVNIGGEGAFTNANTSLKLTVGVNSNEWYYFMKASKANWDKFEVIYNNGKKIVQENGMEFVLNDEEEETYSFVGFYDIVKNASGEAVDGLAIPNSIVVEGKSKVVNAIGTAVFNPNAYINTDIANWIKSLGAVETASAYTMEAIKASSIEYLGNYNFVDMKARVQLPYRLKTERLVGCFNNFTVNFQDALRIPQGVKVLEDCFNFDTCWFNMSLPGGWLFILMPSDFEKFVGRCWDYTTAPQSLAFIYDENDIIKEPTPDDETGLTVRDLFNAALAKSEVTTATWSVSKQLLTNFSTAQFVFGYGGTVGTIWGADYKILVERGF